ncbi:MAG TPA: NAD(P)(+) transhydrogenase (Re/Si-specific) subunit beta, partial [Anaerolineales bacterium]|nr:NAD(P)(+) transhydrogenase (Re/Si-specific) subunit beta [Anaerolineales bacterium]
NYLTEVVYLIASVLFILGLKGLSHPETARRGMHFAEIGMLLAIIGTLVNGHIVTWTWIITGVAIGSAIGAAMAIFMPMTAMPQRIALSHAFGALAAVLVGINEYIEKGAHAELSNFLMGAIGFEVLFGALTVTGSLMAFGKLSELIKSAPITYKGQNFINITLFFTAFGMFIYLIFFPYNATIFYVMIALAFLIGIFIVLPIGGADMPVVISLMNSYAGLAIAATGFAIDNKVLIIAGSLDGASGFILSIIMSQAMNRSFTNVLFGAVGSSQVDSSALAEERPITRVGIEDTKFILEQADRVVVVPGYGMAVAQAQHTVRELSDELDKHGIAVEFAIHPVAGRMPGHMNVLLAEANISYDQLLEMETINPTMDSVDVCIIIGANDVVNPAARTDKSSPIYGMPIIDVDKARTVIVMKRSMAAGFAGIENPLFYEPNTKMLFGDAKKILQELVAEFKK